MYMQTATHKFQHTTFNTTTYLLNEGSMQLNTSHNALNPINALVEQTSTLQTVTNTHDQVEPHLVPLSADAS